MSIILRLEIIHTVPQEGLNSFENHGIAITSTDYDDAAQALYDLMESMDLMPQHPPTEECANHAQSE